MLSPVRPRHLSPRPLSSLTFIDKELPSLDGLAFLRFTVRVGSAQVMPCVLLPQAGDMHTEAIVLGDKQDPSFKVLCPLPQRVDDHSAAFVIAHSAQKFGQICHLGAHGTVKGHRGPQVSINKLRLGLSHSEVKIGFISLGTVPSLADIHPSIAELELLDDEAERCLGGTLNRDANSVFVVGVLVPIGVDDWDTALAYLLAHGLPVRSILRTERTVDGHCFAQVYGVDLSTI